MSIVVWGGFMYLLFCEQSFHLNYSDLTIDTKLLGFKWQKIIPKGSIEKFVQVQDGGRGRDSFPSWGLKLEGSKQARLIFRQPHEISFWLGQVMATWATVEFVPAPQKSTRFRR